MNIARSDPQQGRNCHANGDDNCFLSVYEIEEEEFKRNPSARFLIREATRTETSHADPWHHFRRGAQPLTVVFRNGLRVFGIDCAGWFALRRNIMVAHDLLADRPDLAADAAPDPTPTILAAPPTDLPACVSPLISGFYYVDAPGFLSFGLFGARIYRGFDERLLTEPWRYWIGRWQRGIDHARRFERGRLRGYDGPLLFDRKLLLARRSLVRKH